MFKVMSFMGTVKLVHARSNERKNDDGDDDLVFCAWARFVL